MAPMNDSNNHASYQSNKLTSDRNNGEELVQPAQMTFF